MFYFIRLSQFLDVSMVSQPECTSKHKITVMEEQPFLQIIFEQAHRDRPSHVLYIESPAVN